MLGYDPKDLEQRPLSEFIYGVSLSCLWPSSALNESSSSLTLLSPSRPEPDLAALLNNLHQSVLNRTDLASYHRFLPKSLMMSRRSSRADSAGSNATADGEGESDDGSDSDDSAKVITRKRADLGGRPVLLELRGHGYWGEEAERVPV